MEKTAKYREELRDRLIEVFKKSGLTSHEFAQCSPFNVPTMHQWITKHNGISSRMIERVEKFVVGQEEKPLLLEKERKNILEPQKIKRKKSYQKEDYLNEEFNLEEHKEFILNLPRNEILQYMGFLGALKEDVEMLHKKVKETIFFIATRRNEDIELLECMVESIIVEGMQNK